MTDTEAPDPLAPIADADRALARVTYEARLARWAALDDLLTVVLATTANVRLYAGLGISTHPTTVAATELAREVDAARRALVVAHNAMRGHLADDDDLPELPDPTDRDPLPAVPEASIGEGPEPPTLATRDGVLVARLLKDLRAASETPDRAGPIVVDVPTRARLLAEFVAAFGLDIE